MHNTSVQDLVNTFAMKGSGSEAQGVFERLMSQKINAALDERRVEIAAQVYGKKDE